jgi:23S rRNA (adenine2503-C2)-methyltransferase
MPHLFNATKDDLTAWCEKENIPTFRAKQIIEWVYQKNILDWQKMTNLNKELREKLAVHWQISAMELVQVADSSDGETFKFLWKMKDGSLIESVLILSGDRRTVCVSSQVGCPARCAFCASGKKGLLRNLATHEIVEQILQINQWLNAKGEKVTHVVYMGMGEPLKNYESVVRSIRLLTDPELLNISQRRITVSTVGIVEGIKRLSKEELKVNLVLSLHAPNQHIRQKIIPYARKYPLEDILAAMDGYAEATKRDITYEYTLIAGINDHPDHAFELAKLLRSRQCTINLIPYNPVDGLRLQRPEKQAIKDFRAVLFANKIVNTCRWTKGDDINAACGQLVMRQTALPGSAAAA